MGNFLDKPITAKDLHRVEGNGLVAGAAGMQGWRATMEDAHALSTSIDGLPGWSWFAVFDGHGGSKVAAECARSLLKSITSSSAFGVTTTRATEDGIRAGFLRLDKAMSSDPMITGDSSGATAITALISPTHIFIGNCGDSRAVIVRGGKKIFASKDHKPENSEERRRIEKAHGTVFNRRVNGDLAVSRALGDFSFKSQPQFAQEDQMVSCMPDVTVFERKDDDDFIILACDGLWDVVSSEDAGAFVVAKVSDGRSDMAELAAVMCDDAMAVGSRDNISVMIVAFKAGIARAGGKSKAAAGAGAKSSAAAGAGAGAKDEKK